jgi:pilus assembly protein CpaF
MFGRRPATDQTTAPSAPASAPREPPAQSQTRIAPEPEQPSTRRSAADGGTRPDATRAALSQIQKDLYERVEPTAATKLPRQELYRQVFEIIGELLAERRLSLTVRDQEALCRSAVDDMMGLGPLEPLLRDETISDIMVNGPHQVYIERGGKLDLSPVTFRDNQHVMNVAQRIVTRIGRRVDEAAPICDARLEDGSRVNVIAPPLAIDGCSISIRKFSKKTITLESMAQHASASEPLAQLLKVASASRLNIIISGGTGSGKTTLLNALSRVVDTGERVVTIEDAAELQLQQPHVVRLETRPPSLEGTGEVTIRDLVRNALRMRPDRIICGEVRGGEALDVLQAMNTGHDGSMCTLHANSPREALSRIENMVSMAATTLSMHAIRMQVAAAVNLIVQVARMRDGVRRITHVTELIGMEGDIITMQDLFLFVYESEDRDGRLVGSFRSTGIRPKFLKRAAYYGLEKMLLTALQI